MKGIPMKYRWSAWKVLLKISPETIAENAQLFQWVIELDEIKFEKQIKAYIIYYIYIFFLKQFLKFLNEL